MYIHTHPAPHTQRKTQNPWTVPEDLQSPSGIPHLFPYRLLSHRKIFPEERKHIPGHCIEMPHFPGSSDKYPLPLAVALHYNSLHQRDSPPHHLQRFPGRNPLPDSAFPRHQQEIPQPRLLPHWCCTKTLHTQFLEAAGKLLCPFYRMQDT